MTPRPSMAERLDHAIDELLDGASPAMAAAAAGIAARDRALVEAASSVRHGLPAPPVGPRFEARLGSRLSGAAPGPWILRHPGRLIVTGAVGSAVGVGVTAYAVWRGSRRSSGATRRLLNR